MCFCFVICRLQVWLCACIQCLAIVGVNSWLMDLLCLNSVFLCCFCDSLRDMYKSLRPIKIPLALRDNSVSVLKLLSYVVGIYF